MANNADPRSVRLRERQSNGVAARTGFSSPAAGVSQVSLPSSPGGAEVAYDDGSAAVFEAASRFAGGLADYVGRVADDAARREGAEAGALAGLDPEFRPRADGTLYSQAYDGAGIETFKQQAITRFQTDMIALGEQHGDNPAELKVALAALHKGATDGLVPELRPHVLPEFEAQYRRTSTGLVREATRQHRANVRAAQASALQSSLTTRVRSVQQQAYRLGLDKTADDVLAGEFTELRQLVLQRDPEGKPLIAPAAATRLLEAAQSEIADARLLGAFERMDSLDAKRALIARVEQDFANGKGIAAIYDLDGFNAIRSRMETGLRRAESEARQQTAQLHGEVKSVLDLAQKGYAPPAEGLAALRARVAASGDVDAANGLIAAESVLKFHGQVVAMAPRQLDAMITSERARLKKDGATPAAVARVEYAEKVLDEMRTTLARDPWEWVGRAGVQPVPVRWGQQATDGQSAVDLGVVDLKRRMIQAEEVAGQYGIRPRYFTADDKAALGAMVQAGGPALIQAASTIAEAFGDRADEAFREIGAGKGASGRVLAVFGGMVKDRAATSIIQDVSAGITLRATDDFKPLAGPVKEAQRVISEHAGPALRALGPAVTETVRELATAAYEVRARRAGIIEFDADIYTQVVHEVLGETSVDGVLYGGLGLHRNGWADGHSSRQVLVPPGIRQGRFDDAIDLITNADLEATGLMPFGDNGQPLSAEAVRRGVFVAVGSGSYWVALGEPEGDDPQWLLDADGRRLVIDFRKLTPRLKRRDGSLFLGGS